MKTNQILIPLITIITIVLSACQKEMSLERNQILPISSLTGDSIYLSKKYYIEKFGSSIDTAITTYYYDNLKRVSKIIEINKINGTIDFKDSIKYFYTGTDTVPIKKSQYSEEFGNNASRDTFLSFYTYNNFNQLIVDSTLNFDHEISFYNYTIRKSIYNYSYSSNKIYGFKSFKILYNFANFEDDVIQRDTATIDMNKNIIESRQTQWIGTSPTIVESKLYTFTYDNKHSPYLKQNINYIFPNIPEGNNLYYLNQLGSKNNRLKVSQDVFTAGGGYYISEDLTGKYLYNSLGFPREIFNPEPTLPTDYTKFIFVYTNL